MSTHLSGFFSRKHFSLARAAAALALFAALGLMASTHAAPLTAADQKRVRSVVEGQLAAFSRDDANKAFSYAAPNIRETVGSAASFMTMVRRDYPMVYRPASVTFHKPEQDAGSVLQLVEITDTEAKSWFALFALEQQPDASWRISGCVVRENRWQPV